MINSQYYKNLEVPKSMVDVVLDTDTYNEMDDQFALSYLLRSTEKLNTVAIYAAPFSNYRAKTPKIGMEKSYDEILKLLKLLKREDLVSATFKGSDAYLSDEDTPVLSSAAEDLIKRAKEYSPEKPLYVVAIGAITNIASALLMDPSIADNIVIVWLGGHAYDHKDTGEFNMVQDIAAARVVFGSEAPLVQLPCVGVVSGFYFSILELEHYLRGKNELCDFLLDRAIECYNEWTDRTGKYDAVYSKVIWDVTAVAWLLNDDDRFMMSHFNHCPMPEYDKQYSVNPNSRIINSVYHIFRDGLATDMIEKLTKLS